MTISKLTAERKFGVHVYLTKNEREQSANLNKRLNEHIGHTICVWPEGLQL